MIATEKEYQEMWKEFNGKTFTPLTNLIIEETEVDGVKEKVFKYEIIKSANEVYQEYLDKKNNPPKKEPTKEEILLKEIANLKVDNMKKDVIATNTLKSLAELKVEIMELKGGNK
ncbi:hypothetical protein [Clostridium sp. M14]|uniref:hypothetical protein n=1 Tax=Clostridium sp. M14 TaxID=2716311 RepID=UPI0013EEB022|nr:hypothetical protein [Clostridium sp. M14]MBZ9693206.1 hypothetical protein [Clostridium sp. M14]